MDEIENSENEDKNSIDRETFRNWLREDLSSILPDFMNSESEETEAEEDTEQMGKPLSAKDVESIINKQMKEAMKVLQASKPKKVKMEKIEDEEEELEKPVKKSIPKEETPEGSPKKFDITKILWGE